jgi:hypothetical protein
LGTRIKAWKDPISKQSPTSPRSLVPWSVHARIWLVAVVFLVIRMSFAQKMSAVRSCTCQQAFRRGPQTLSATRRLYSDSGTNKTASLPRRSSHMSANNQESWTSVVQNWRIHKAQDQEHERCLPSFGSLPPCGRPGGGFDVRSACLYQTQGCLVVRGRALGLALGFLGLQASQASAANLETAVAEGC